MRGSGNSTISVHTVDFLPAKYRERSAKRRNRLWKLTVVLVVSAMVGATSLFQHHLKCAAQRDVAAVAPLYQAAVAETERSSAIHQEVRIARSEAQLYTYLGHPWPKTQVLTALFRSLPKSITIHQLHLGRVTPPKPTQKRQTLNVTAESGEKQQDLSHLLPAEHDLHQLRHDIDPQQMVVELAGTTRDEAALHRYIGQLGRISLFKNVELLSIEKDSSSEAKGNNDVALLMRFNARVMLRPCYGQPNGPSGEESLSSSHGVSSGKESPQ